MIFHYDVANHVVFSFSTPEPEPERFGRKEQSTLFAETNVHDKTIKIVKWALLIGC